MLFLLRLQAEISGVFVGGQGVREALPGKNLWSLQPIPCRGNILCQFPGVILSFSGSEIQLLGHPEVFRLWWLTSFRYEREQEYGSVRLPWPLGQDAHCLGHVLEAPSQCLYLTLIHASLTNPNTAWQTHSLFRCVNKNTSSYSHLLLAWESCHLSLYRIFAYLW